MDSSFQSGVYTASANSTSDQIQSSSLIIPVIDQSTTTGWYYLKVSANNNSGGSRFSSLATIMPQSVPAQAVSNLQWINQDSSGNLASQTVTLTWTYNVDSSCPLLGFILC
jgi:hypothetical protein